MCLGEGRRSSAKMGWSLLHIPLTGAWSLWLRSKVDQATGTLKAPPVGRDQNILKVVTMVCSLDESHCLTAAKIDWI